MNIAVPRAVCLLWLCCLLPRPACAWSTLENWADVIFLQMKAREPLPALSSYGAALDLGDAYAVQRLLLRELAAQSPLVGFKAELTTPLSRVKMRSQGPVFSGVLKHDLLVPGRELGPARAGQHAIAPALGFVLRRRLAAPLEDPARLPDYLARMLPVVMVFDHRFENRAAVRAEDLVAANGAHTRLIVGKDFPAVDLAAADRVFVEIRHNDNVIERGKATNVMGGQAAGLLWLVNEIVARGQVLVPGQFVVTGPMVEPMPIAPGEYVVDFWEHERIPVTLRAPGT